MRDVLIGAISGNYKVNDIERWVKTSKWENVDRVLLLYNDSNPELEAFLISEDVQILKPNFDFWGNEKSKFNFDTGKCDLEVSFDLIHNMRFFHIWSFLEQAEYNKVLITDVRDVYFNRNPFYFIDPYNITATSEEITYESESWNQNHLHTNLGIIGLNLMLDKQVYNVGVFGGGKNLIRDLCSDIYLLSIGKHKVADQTSFNYLIQTKYKKETSFTSLRDSFAVHLHVINAGLVKFDLSSVNKYAIVHQYDRIKNFSYDKG